MRPTTADMQSIHSASPPWKHFAVGFLLLAGLFFLLLEIAPPAFYHLSNRLNTVLTARLMGLVNIRPTISDTLLTLDGFTVNVIGECSAIFLLALLAAFILAYPAAWRQRLAGLFTCIPVVMMVNIVRIAVVFYAGSRYRPLFKPLHLYFGQVLMIIAVLVVVQVWLRRLSGVEFNQPRMGFALRFVLFASPLFLLWLWIAPAYLALANEIIFSTLKELQFLNLTKPVWASDPAIPLTFNLVVFCSLVLSSQQQPWGWKAFGISAGILVLVGGHLILKAGHLAFLQYQKAWLMRSLNAWLLINQWLLPLGGWMAWQMKAESKK